MYNTRVRRNKNICKRSRECIIFNQSGKNVNSRKHLQSTDKIRFTHAQHYTSNAQFDFNFTETLSLQRVIVLISSERN